MRVDPAENNPSCISMGEVRRLRLYGRRPGNIAGQMVIAYCDICDRPIFQGDEIHGNGIDVCRKCVHEG